MDNVKDPANRDPITNEPGSHPVGTATGSAGGAIAGGAVGAVVAGPVGAAVGGVIGAVAGAAAGHEAAEAVNPTVEAAFWREEYRKRPYFRQGDRYEDFEPAYKLGWESASRPEYKGRTFEQIEPDLGKTWAKSASSRPWDSARDATRDAWTRVRARNA